MPGLQQVEHPFAARRGILRRTRLTVAQLGANTRCCVLSEECRKVEHMLLSTITPGDELERINSREHRYSLGQFFTPQPIAELMAEAVLEVDPLCAGGSAPAARP